MRKIFIFAALAFGLASCQKETSIFGVNVNTNEEAVEFTIHVAAPDVEGTRAAASWADSAAGAIANGVLGTPSDDVTMRYILDIYDANGDRSDERYFAYTDDRNVSFSPRLVPGREYTFVVWADIVSATAKADVHYNTADLTTVTLKDEWNPMDETRDAYTGFLTVTLEKTADLTIKLVRPFGKIRVITEDMAAVNDLGITPDHAEVTYTTAYRNQFNAKTGEYTVAGNANKKTHTKFEIANYGSNVYDASMALFTDYLFAPNGTDVVSFTMEVFGTDEKNNHFSMKTTKFPTDIPVKRNTLTTITGKFLTVQGDDYAINVIVENEGSFTGFEDYDVQ